jgi:hypothetical protein
MNRLFARRVFGWIAFSLAMVSSACRPAVPAGGVPNPAPRVEEADAPRGEAIVDPTLREARDQADALMARLLAGQLDNDPDVAPLARKLKGYHACAIKGQQVVRENAAEFRGVLTGPAAHARFSMTVVKQANGPWAIGHFSGPDAE